MTAERPQAAAQLDGDQWFTGRNLACLIALLLFALYPGVFLGTQSFFFRDFGGFSYPNDSFFRDSFWRGEAPLWNPYNNCGMPFLAQWNTSACYPLSLLYLLLPQPWSVNIFSLGHQVLAGVGMYLLASRWTNNRLAASLAGLAFGLNGLMFNCLMWTSNLASLAWQPFVILLVERAWRLGGRRNVVLASLAGAMQMLAGAPEIILFTWAMLGFLWLAGAWRKSFPFGRSLARFAVMVALVTGLAAWQLMPFLDVVAHSQRDAGQATAALWPMPLWGVANYLLPLFHCWHTALGTPFQDGQSWTSSYYPGAAILVLAVTGLLLNRELKVWWLAAAALAGLLLGFGNEGHIYPLVRRIAPVIGFARYPIKFVALPAFCLPLLAAYGFNSFSRPANGNTRGPIVLGIVAALAMATIVVLLGVAHQLPQPRYLWSFVLQDGLARAFFLAAVIGVIFLLGRARSAGQRTLMGFLLLALVGADAIIAANRQNPVVSMKAFGPIEMEMSFRPKPGESRALVSSAAQRYIGTIETTNPAAYYLAMRGALTEDSNLPEKIPKVDGFYSLYLAEDYDVFTEIYSRTNPPPAGLADFLGVAQMTRYGSLYDWDSRPSFLPLVTAGQRPVFVEDAHALEKIIAADFDPRQVVYLPTEAQGKIVATNSTAARVRNVEFSARRIRLESDASAPSMVVIAQSYYHNWRALVDGQPGRLWRANYAYQAVAVPAGRHEITLVYRDRAFQVGTVLSALTLLACLASLLIPDATRHSV